MANSLTIGEEDYESVVKRLVADALATTGAPHEREIRDRAASFRSTVGGSVEALLHLTTETIQQDFHDDFVDTTWPACPLHFDHPLWLREGWWCCERDGRVRVAKVGTLGLDSDAAG